MLACLVNIALHYVLSSPAIPMLLEFLDSKPFLFTRLHTLPFSVSCKSFACHSYENYRMYTNNSHSGSPEPRGKTRRASLTKPLPALSFQSLANCPFRNLLILTTMQTAWDVVYLAEFSSHSEPRTINLSVCRTYKQKGVERGSVSQNWLSVQDGPKLDLGPFGTRVSFARGSRTSQAQSHH